MTEKITVENFKSIKDVRGVMTSLGLPVLDDSNLMAVGKIEGKRFKEALANVANNEDPQNHEKGYIMQATVLLTGTMMQALATLGYANVTAETLINIGKNCAKEFRSQLNLALVGNSDGKVFVQKKINEFTVHNKTPSDTRVQQEYTPPPASNASRGTGSDFQQNNKPDLSQQHSPYPNSKQSTTAQTKKQTERSGFFSETFYGKTVALCFHAVSSEDDGAHSVIVDAGNKKENQPEGGRAINWDDKIVLGFSFEEMVETSWVLMGIAQDCNFTNHGAAHDKSFSLKRQDGGFFASLTAKGKNARGIPMSHAAGARLMLLITMQINKNYPNMTATEIVNMLRLMAKPKVAAKIG